MKGEFEIVLQGGRVVRASARDASRGEMAKRLQAALKIPVRVSDALSRTRATFSPIENLPLTDLLTRLAPVVYLDSREPWGANPELLAIHLLEATEPEPPALEATAIAIEGTVEDSDDAEDNDPRPASDRGARASAPAPSPVPEDGPFLRVLRLADGRLNIDARDQGLGVLLFQAAQACGARFDLRIPEAPVVGRFSVNGILPSQLPTLLGFPGVGVDVRRNVLTGDETVLRFFVDVAP